MTTRSSIRVKARVGFNPDVATVRLRISGRVQGVGFRAFVAELAARHGLNGEVWNSRDGDVGAVFDGEDAAVQAAVGEIPRGPGRVAGVVCDSIAPETTYDGFRVGHTR